MVARRFSPPSSAASRQSNRTRVEIIDPAIMVTVTGNLGLQPVATEARTRLTAVLHSLTASPPAS